MEWLTGYVVKTCAAALISFVVDMLLPEGNIKRTARFCASLVITIIICAPLINLFTQQQTVITPPDENHSVPDESDKAKRGKGDNPAYKNSRRI